MSTTAPALPLSLSPHVCVLPSPDLVQLLASSGLPPLQHLLQSFSPLPQITTRTITLTPVSHASFPLRFSDLSDIETACKEDEDERAGRTIDWIGQRVTRRAATWVERVERERDFEMKGGRTPWWEELRRCTEGDHTPTRIEGWNHPIAVILAVSTLAPNPLQAVTDLQSRHIDLPLWVDPTMLRHNLIIHIPNSPLNSDEAMALFNATKRQYGLHTHLLTLSLLPPSKPIPVPSLLPELPQTPMVDGSFKTDSSNKIQSINLTEQDVAQFARFVREFVTMSLVPWMERCVMEWNETYSSNRRLPSRLFSSTRRLFGGTSINNSPAAPPVHSSAQHPNATSSTNASFTTPPPQQRRLAEFATFLGDVKLAVSVWETLRKDGRGGSEVLPLLLAPSPTLSAHAAYALSTLQTQGAGPSSQLRALVYAIRWEAGVRDLSNLGGERWLEWAAGNTEEPPPALLLAHAALICARKGATRRAAMWYVFAAHRLEKCGIKPLTVYFLRKAHELYRMKPRKNLSPSFYDSEFKKDLDGFDAILPSIEYSLGRLMYTSGDTEGALRHFLGLLRGSLQRGHRPQEVNETDPLYLGDFKVAFEHLKSTVGSGTFPTDLKLPFSFSRASETKIQLARQGELDVDAARWEELEQTWKTFWKSHGEEQLEKGGKAVVGERFLVELVLQNPLDAEVTLANFTVEVESGLELLDLEVEVIDNVVLLPKEARSVPVSIICHRSGTLKITHLSYSFLSLLPVNEGLAVRGARLHQTAAQRQNVTYGPDIELKIDVEDGGRRLDLSFSHQDERDRKSVLGVGECVDLTLNIKNTGRGDVNDIWVLHNSAVCFDFQAKKSILPLAAPSSMNEVFRSDNSLSSIPPIPIPLASLHTSSVLAPDDSLDLHLVVHVASAGSQEVPILLVFRETGQRNFYSARLHHTFEVVPMLGVAAWAKPNAGLKASYLIGVEVKNVSEASEVDLSQLTCASANWACTSGEQPPLGNISKLLPRQAVRVLLTADYCSAGSGSSETKGFVLRQLEDVIRGRPVKPSEPPPLDVVYSHVNATKSLSACDTTLLNSSMRISTFRALADRFYQLAPSTLPSIFPLRNPQALDIIVSWEMPSERRRGYVISRGLLLGACHAPLDKIIQQLEAAKVKRTMYAETNREKGEVMEAVRSSEWNTEMDPTVIRVTSEPRIEHDFLRGHCLVPVTFTIRNFSLTNHTRFVLRLQSIDSFRSSEAQHLPPGYTGTQTRRGALAPLASVQIQARMWITRPGVYGLNGWQIDTEVGELNQKQWRTCASFSQEAPVGEENIVTIVQQPS